MGIASQLERMVDTGLFALEDMALLTMHGWHLVTDACDSVRDTFNPLSGQHHHPIGAWRSRRERRAYLQRRVDELGDRVCDVLRTRNAFQDRVDAALTGKLCFMYRVADNGKSVFITDPDHGFKWSSTYDDGFYAVHNGRAGQLSVPGGSLEQLALVRNYLSYAADDLMSVLAHEVLVEQSYNGRDATSVRLKSGHLLDGKRRFDFPRTLRLQPVDKDMHNCLAELSTAVDGLFQLIAKQYGYDDGKGRTNLRCLVEQRLRQDDRGELADHLTAHFYDNDVMRRFNNNLRNPTMHGNPVAKHELKFHPDLDLDAMTIVNKYALRTIMPENGKPREYLTGLMLNGIVAHIYEGAARAIELLYKDVPVVQCTAAKEMPDLCRALP